MNVRGHYPFSTFRNAIESKVNSIFLDIERYGYSTENEDSALKEILDCIDYFVDAGYISEYNIFLIDFETRKFQMEYVPNNDDNFIEWIMMIIPAMVHETAHVTSNWLSTMYGYNAVKIPSIIKAGMI